MIETILLEIAIFIFLMVAIGIGLTIYEFKHDVMEDDENTKK